MATGYTQELINKDLDFRGFAMLCVRAMGVAITMRDDPLDTPIPEEFKPSDWNLKEGNKSRAKLAKLQKLAPDQRVAWAKRDMKKRIKVLIGLAEQHNRDKNVKKMETMLAEVQAWKPPTKDHQNFKDFMVQQLTSSLDSERSGTDYYSEEVTKLKNTEPTVYFKQEVAKTKSEVAYHKKHYAEEVERVRVRNQWIRKLRASLKI